MSVLSKISHTSCKEHLSFFQELRPLGEWVISVKLFGLVSERATHEQTVLLILEVFTDNSSKQHQSNQSINQNLWKWS